MLALSALLLSIALATCTSTSSSSKPAPDLGTVFAVYPGWDMDNGNAPPLANVTEMACMQACGASTSCVAYAYVAYNSFRGPGATCYPKTGIDISKFKQQSDADVSTGVIGACGTLLQSE
ncbi:hypothetical protein C8R45DRAFT_1109475 [Mycena sanguinolenta]|nr:hypothetical protein C8R45DRAFT_1109475 [Mycena sanguinolenta]